MQGMCKTRFNGGLEYIENETGLFGIDQEGVLQFFYCNQDNRGIGCTQENPIVKALAIPEGVKSIPDDSFRNYTVLWELSFPKTLKAIGTGLGGAFSHCNLPDITFCEELEYLGPWVFAGSSLRSLRLIESHMPIRPENQFQGTAIDNLIHGETGTDSRIVDEYARWNCPMAPKTNWLIPEKSNAFNESMYRIPLMKGTICTSEGKSEYIAEKKALWNGPIASSEDMKTLMSGAAFDSERWFRSKVEDAWGSISVSLLQHLLKSVVVRTITDGDGRIENLEKWKNRMT